ncbi:MAG: aldehyde dehydrogenase family protein, partial [Actinomycetes bacterium]|nr:aldehyde dehydrogenase family protein [Actinomycetes bacterium]
MTIKEIFDSMAYGPAPESATEALAWIAKHQGTFGHFIDGQFTAPGETFTTHNPATGKPLAEITQGTAKDVAKAVAAARRAQPKWAALPAFRRAEYLYALARLTQKHSRLLATLETLDNGKPIRESRDIDIPLVARHFSYHAGLAQLLPSEHPDLRPLGVCGAVIPWNFPLLMLAWKVAPALAAGNTVVLKPAEYTPLTALLFAEISREAGLPKGVLNIVTGDGTTGAALVDSPVDKIAFTGSTSVGKRIREATAGTGKALTLELGGKSPYIVFDDADLDSAIEGLVDAIWFNQGQVCCAGSRLLVQEGVAPRFYEKLKRRMDGLRIGDPLDKAIDIGAIVDPIQLDTITRLV